jgi:hypothetical protein
MDVTPEDCDRLARGMLRVLILAVGSTEQFSEQDESDLLVVAGAVDYFKNLVSTEHEGDKLSIMVSDDELGDFETAQDYISTLIRLRQVEALN